MNRLSMRNLGGKNGVEIEGYVQSIDELAKHRLCLGFVHGEAVDLFKKKISTRFYVDDGKMEYPSNPKTNLEDLCLEIKEVFTEAFRICRKRNWLLSLIGCHPFSGTFASNHVHTSLRASPLEKDVKRIRELLFSVQPYIALLGQNSPFLLGQKAGYKDVRLAFSTWSEFTAPKNNTYSHYLSLATGRDAHTLECRIPSSATLHQILASVVFIKTVVELNQTPILPVNHVEKIFYRVLKYGGEALVPIFAGQNITYLGTGKELLVPISELFKIFLTDKETSSCLKEILSELPKTYRTSILEFYEIIASGLTASDYILQLSQTNNFNVRTISERLNYITKRAYVDNIPFWKLMPKPKKPELPKIEGKVTLEEARKYLMSQNIAFDIQAPEDLDYLLNTSKYSLRKCVGTRLILKKILSNEYITSDSKPPELSALEFNKIAKFLEKRRVLELIREYPLKYGPGKWFNYLIQLGREAKLL